MSLRGAPDTLSESLEDYLEAILILSRDGRTVRVKDLMALLKYKVSSVNNAVKHLAARGLVKHVKYGPVLLTPAGRTVAERVFSRHENIDRFFQRILGVDKDTARHDACRIEHALSPETYARFLAFITYVEHQLTAAEIARGIARFKDG